MYFNCGSIKNFLNTFFQDDNIETFRISGGVDCVVNCFKKHSELKRDAISCLAHFIDGKRNNFITVLFIHFSTVSVGRMIFDKGIMKTFIGFTSEFVQDSELCEDVVKILFVMFNSLRFHSQTERFFHEIGEFKSAVAILSANSKSEVVCTNVIKLISGLLSDCISLKVSQKRSC